MQVNIEDVSSVKKILHIEIPEEDVQKKVDEAFNQLKYQAKVKGFRPGKAPRNVLKRMYGKNVYADVANNLVQEAVSKAIEQQQLKYVGNPSVEDTYTLEENQPFSFDVTVEVRPELPDVQISGTKLTRHVYKVTDEQVDLQLKMLQKKSAERKQLDENATLEKGHFALVDLQGFKDGRPYDEIPTLESHSMKIGDDSFAPGLDDQIIGMKRGETKTVTVKFPDDYINEALAGTEAQIRVHLRELYEEVLPEIDDELAKNLGSFETLDDLKKTIHDDLVQMYQKRSEQELYEQFFSQYLDANDFEVPDALVRMELDEIVAETERTYERHNMSLEDMGITRQAIEEKYQDLAIKKVKRRLILDKIITQEKLEASEEALDEEYEKMAKVLGQSVEDIKQFYMYYPPQHEMLKYSILEKQAMGLILDNSEITEVEVDPESESEQGQPENTELETA